jgi:hypothetical protein
MNSNDILVDYSKGLTRVSDCWEIQLIITNFTILFSFAFSPNAAPTLLGAPLIWAAVRVESLAAVSVIQ